jgi:hypothetical protein
VMWFFMLLLLSRDIFWCYSNYWYCIRNLKLP